MKRVKLNELSLDKKVELIRAASSGDTVRSLSTRFNVSVGTVSNILHGQNKILELWDNLDENAPKRAVRMSQFERVDELSWSWFKEARARGVPVSGPVLQQKALSIAGIIGQTDFKAPNGWLNAFRKRHEITFRAISGNEDNVNESTVLSWTSSVSALLAGYEKRDLFNCDETALFFRAISNKSLAVKGESCKGVVSTKERFTVLLCANAEGGKEKPLVIWKSLKPRCFGRIDHSQLPVEWYASKSAWMTTEIFQGWLNRFNARMRAANRNVALLFDNATCHRVVELSNVRMIALPPNTTSRTQPLDQGVIKSFKAHYRRRLVEWMITRIDNTINAGTLVKTIDKLLAVGWIRDAWFGVSESCIVNCFRRAGVFGNMIIEADHDVESQDVLQQPIVNGSEIEELEQAEAHAQICDNGEDWEQEFYSNIMQSVDGNKIQTATTPVHKSRCRRKEMLTFHSPH